MASTALSVIFPPILETMTFWPNKLGRWKWRLILNSCIILFGFYVFIAGTALSISNIVTCIREGTRCDDWSFRYSTQWMMKKSLSTNFPMLFFNFYLSDTFLNGRFHFFSILVDSTDWHSLIVISLHFQICRVGSLQLFRVFGRK